MSLGGIKTDQDKPRVDLVPVQSIIAAARAFTFGAKKYSPWNWMKGLAWLRLYGAVMRHMFEFAIGVTKDKESGLHPLDHALASLMMLQTHVELGLGKDDRAHIVVAETAGQDMPPPVTQSPPKLGYYQYHSARSLRDNLGTVSEVSARSDAFDSAFEAEIWLVDASPYMQQQVKNGRYILVEV